MSGADAVRVQLARSDDPRAAEPGTLVLPRVFADVAPKLAGLTGACTEAAEKLRLLAVMMWLTLRPQCPCPTPLHTMRCGIGGRPVIILEEDEVAGEELDPTECTSGLGEHDYSNGVECRDCGAEPLGDIE